MQFPELQPSGAAAEDDNVLRIGIQVQKEGLLALVTPCTSPGPPLALPNPPQPCSQIRAGDWTFEGADIEMNFRSYLPFFYCAREIEDYAKPREDTKALWYLISDSQALREKALKQFGPDKLVTLTRKHHHIACNVADCQAEQRNQTATLINAVADLYSLARTDYQVGQDADFKCDCLLACLFARSGGRLHRGCDYWSVAARN